ncbi:MAG: hypothetical protein R2819_09190 [Allomuricauda sp.]
MTYLLSIILLLGCGQTPSTGKKMEFENRTEQNQISDQLTTGWYYLTDKENGLEKVLKGTEKIYFIDPKPIVTVDNFTELEIYQSNYGDYGLAIRLDKKGTENWSIATGKSIGEKLALIIDNELYQTSIVNSQIDAGITALNRGDLSEQELKVIKQKIEKEKK